ncbi:MAG: PqqD family protein [Acidimicrobiales bacterium]
MSAVAEAEQRRQAPRQRGDVWLRATGDENMLLDHSGRNLYRLNPTALALWELCDGTTLPEEMVEAICTLFTGIYDVIQEDVERTLQAFTRAGLVEWQEVGPR